MNNDVENNDYIDTVVALSAGAGGHGPFRAVMLRRAGNSFELVWRKTAGSDETDWDAFFAEVVPPDSPGSSSAVAIVYESVGVGFYRIEIPQVDDRQVEAIVRMQAEALLPLGVEQMEFAFRVDEAKGGRRGVTIAAAKSSQLKPFVAKIRKRRPKRIMLDYTGLVKAWRMVFGGSAVKAVIINIGDSDTEVLLAENGKLCHGLRIDVGAAELDSQEDWQGAAELFVHDLRSALELFGIANSSDVEIHFLSENARRHERLIGYLGEAGIKTEAAVAQPDLLGEAYNLTGGEVCEYADLIGSGIMILEGEECGPDLFGDLYRLKEADDSKTNVSLKRPIVITLVVFVLFLLVCYAIDKSSLAKLKRHLDEPAAGEGAVSANVLIEKQRMQKTIASQRPDVLDLLSKINTSGPDGVMLDRFSFKKNQAVTIAGTAKSIEQSYEFKKNLLTKSGITDVRVQNPTFDEKKKQASFKMTMHYKNFTRKSKRR